MFIFIPVRCRSSTVLSSIVPSPSSTHPFTAAHMNKTTQGQLSIASTNPRLLSLTQIEIPTIAHIETLDRVTANLKKEISAARERERQLLDPKLVDSLQQSLQILSPFKQKVLEYLDRVDKKLEEQQSPESKVGRKD